MENNSRKSDNKVDKLIKNFSLAIIFILVISLIISLININNLKNSQQSFNSLIGGISLMVVPYMAISIVTQVIIFVLTFFKKKIKLFFFIISLVIEIIFLIFATATLRCPKVASITATHCTLFVRNSRNYSVTSSKLEESTPQRGQTSGG